MKTYMCDGCFKVLDSDRYCCMDGDTKLVVYDYLREGDDRNSDWAAALEHDDIPMGFGPTAEAALEDLQEKLIAEREYQLDRQIGAI